MAVQQRHEDPPVPGPARRPVFFGNSGPTNHHVGIYIGNGQMIHAPNSRTVVKISSIYYSGDLIQTVARY